MFSQFVFVIQDEVEKKSPMLLQLGLLFETKTSVFEKSTFVTFQHISFQEYTSSLYISKRLDRADNVKVKTFFIIIKL